MRRNMVVNLMLQTKRHPRGYPDFPWGRENSCRGHEISRSDATVSRAGLIRQSIEPRRSGGVWTQVMEATQPPGNLSGRGTNSTNRASLAVSRAGLIRQSRHAALQHPESIKSSASRERLLSRSPFFRLVWRELCYKE